MRQSSRLSFPCLIILYSLKSCFFKLKINFTALSLSLFFFFLVGMKKAYLLLVGKLENMDKKKKKSSNMVISIYSSSAVCWNISSTFLSAFGVFCHFDFNHYVDVRISWVFWSFGILFLKYLFKSLTHFPFCYISFFYWFAGICHKSWIYNNTIIFHCQAYELQISSKCMVCLFTLLTVSSNEQNS